VLSDDIEKRILVLMTDASATAIAAVMYEVHVTPHGTKSYLLQARTQTIPLKQQKKFTGKDGNEKEFFRVNKAELNAAALGTEMLEQHEETSPHNYDRIVAFTDSMVVCHWLWSPLDNHNQYIRRRVFKITNVLKSDNWVQDSSTDPLGDVTPQHAFLAKPFQVAYEFQDKCVHNQYLI
jgi:hypothetical protein